MGFDEITHQFKKYARQLQFKCAESHYSGPQYSMKQFIGAMKSHSLLLLLAFVAKA